MRSCGHLGTSKLEVCHPQHHLLEVGKELALCHGIGVFAHLHSILAPDGGRDGRINEIVEALEASGRDHGINLSPRGAVVAWDEAARETRDTNKDEGSRFAAFDQPTPPCMAGRLEIRRQLTHRWA